MSLRSSLSFVILLAAAAPGFAERQWIVYCNSNNAPQSPNTWYTVPSGDFDGRAYRWFDTVEAVARGFWDVTTDNTVPVAPNTDLFPVKPGMYTVEQWAPSVQPSESWWAEWSFSAIETTFDGPGAGEEATNNLLIPWNGAFNTNHQWIKSDMGTSSGVWKPCGSGPQCPDSALCTASGNSANSVQMWMKRGSTLYIKWNFPFEVIAPLTALRLTEVYSDNTPCDNTATLGGSVDLRCIGNADPIYYGGEAFSNSSERNQQTTAIDGEHAFAVQGYSVWICLDPGYPYNVPLSPGLPGDGNYTAYLADRDVPFHLNYNGFNSIKWKSQDTGEFAEARVATLNAEPGREFVPGTYQQIELLTASSGGLGHRLNIQTVYGDSSTETSTINLYDWFRQNGDADNVAVGVNGTRRSEGALGFRTLGKQGDSVEHGGGGDTGGAFMIAHRVSVNSCKMLTQVNISADFPHATPFLVESRSGGQNYANFSTTGGWSLETYKSGVGEVTPGIGCLAAGAGSGGTTATFSFTPSLSMYYNVRATWDNNLDASQNAAFVVTHDDGPTTVFKNQHDGGDGWQDLGQFHLTAGQVYTVTLDAAQSTNGPRVFADAVRWETPGINATLLAATFVAGGNCCNRPWADVDADHDVDMTDFATFQACLTTDSNEILPECGCMDADGNGSIDSTDLAYFLACGLGPAIEFVHNSSSPYWPNWPVGCPNQPTE